MIDNFNDDVRKSYSALSVLLKEDISDVYVVTREHKNCGMIMHLYWSKIELKYHCSNKWCSVCRSRLLHVASEAMVKTNLAGEIIKE